MKKKLIYSKFTLNKKTVANLNNREMLSINAGYRQTDPYYCMTNGCTFDESDWLSCRFSCTYYCSQGPC